MRTVAVCAAVIALSTVAACATGSKPASTAPQYNFDDGVVSGDACQCSSTPIPEDHRLRADRAVRSARAAVVLEQQAQPWFAVPEVSADVALELVDAYRADCGTSDQPGCQGGEAFNGTLTVSAADGRSWGSWPVAVSRADSDALAVSTRITPPASWKVRQPLPPGSQLHLILETLHPLRGEIFALVAGQQNTVATLHE